MVARFLTLLTLVLIVAFLFGLFLSSFGVKLWLGVLIGFVGQFLLHNIFTSVLNAYVIIQNKKLENERIKEFSVQGMEVTCPCSKKRIDFVPVRLNEQNSYRCGDCEKMVSVYVSGETAMQTDPILSNDTTSALQPAIAAIKNGNS